MKYSFFSSACAWLPSALMMAVSASGASSAPLASFVRYVPVEGAGGGTNRYQDGSELVKNDSPREGEEKPEDDGCDREQHQRQRSVTSKV